MQDLGFGTATYLSATGTVCITSANARIIGVMFNGTGTGKLSIFAGVTSTATSSAAPLSGQIIAYSTAADATVNKAVYFPFPAYASGGITTVVGGSADPKVTLFWSPVGGA